MRPEAWQLSQYMATIAAGEDSRLLSCGVLREIALADPRVMMAGGCWYLASASRQEKRQLPSPMASASSQRDSGGYVAGP